MKNVALLAGLVVLALGCSTQDDVTTKTPTDLTGNSVTYTLTAGSYWDVNGTVVFNEKKDGTTNIVVKLNNLGDDTSEHPVHLHLGDISTDKAAVAAQLTALDGKTGISSTDLKSLADESTITYAQLKSLNACIKVHLSFSGDGQSIVLAGGNVGTAVSNASNGRLSMGVCKSE